MRHALFAIIIVASSFQLSCNSPEDVAKFCVSANAALNAGNNLFEDMKASCVREVESREPLGSFSVSAPDADTCNQIGNQAAGLKAASAILSAYFTSVHDLASFGAAKTGADVQDLLTKASTQAKLSAGAGKSLGLVAGLVTRVATSGYQRKHLAKDIVAVQPDIKIALDGLAEAVGVAYLHLLQAEERKTAVRYKEFVLERKASAEAILLLDNRWQAERANILARQNAAIAYQGALATIAKANADLAANAGAPKGKERLVLLNNYTVEVETLVPSIRKAF